MLPSTRSRFTLAIAAALANTPFIGHQPGHQPTQGGRAPIPRKTRPSGPYQPQRDTRIQFFHAQTSPGAASINAAILKRTRRAQRMGQGLHPYSTKVEARLTGRQIL